MGTDFKFTNHVTDPLSAGTDLPSLCDPTYRRAIRVDEARPWRTGSEVSCPPWSVGMGNYLEGKPPMPDRETKGSSCKTSRSCIRSHAGRLRCRLGASFVGHISPQG